MQTYSFLREFADSWMLLFLFSFFVVMVLWLFRPSAKQEHNSSADIPFRHELAPAPVDDIEEPRT